MIPVTRDTSVSFFKKVRERTLAITAPLCNEDMVVQPIVDVSPPKWHLGHTTWFFEQFFLSSIPGYRKFNDEMAYVFNSYYETIGTRVMRTDRGNLSRPNVSEVQAYRAYVDTAMEEHLKNNELSDNQLEVLIIGLNHEQQHQELLVTDLKYILGHNPLFPEYGDLIVEDFVEKDGRLWLEIQGGIHWIGHEGDGFHWDNEIDRHQVLVNDFAISNKLITNGEYLAFMNAGGYDDFNYWHMEGHAWVKENRINSPLYWHEINGIWHHYSLRGLEPIDMNAPLKHISYYEAYAFNEWNGTRLPTEGEWEVASEHFNWGQRWEFTQSAYLPYPGYTKAEGALGEYNGKFMVNQMVLRGASVATPDGHSRSTYRNFFHPHLQWQYTGIRSVKK